VAQANGKRTNGHAAGNTVSIEAISPHRDVRLRIRAALEWPFFV